MNLGRWLVVLWLGGLLPAQGETFDLIIRDGRVADGTGNPAYHADVAIRDGRIMMVGRVTGQTERELDAGGCLVAPGFIDVHTHAENIEELPLAENYLRMGVTTLILGNCGDSVMEVGPFLDRLEGLGLSANVATLLGQGTVRAAVMGGSFMRPPTEWELTRMKERVEEAMRAGALGLSTGLIYLPGTFAKTEELIELARVVARFDGIYVSHMRDEADGVFEALEEVCRIAREAAVRAQVSHIKLSGKQNWGQVDRVLALLEAARAEGLDITQDMYVYPASSTGLSQLIPPEARAEGRFSERLADPGEKARIVAALKERLAARHRDSYDYVMIAHCEQDSALDGLTVPEAARKRRGDDSLDSQIEFILEVQAQGGASAVFFGMSEEDLTGFLRHANTMIGADSSVRRFQEGFPHPRGYGNAARVLARYVRERQVLRWEDAVRRMTSLPAQTFGLHERGLVRAGSWADLVVFDPAMVMDHATFQEPHQYATGFRWVLVNGQVVVAHDRHTGARPGRILRHRLP